MMISQCCLDLQIYLIWMLIYLILNALRCLFCFFLSDFAALARVMLIIPSPPNGRRYPLVGGKR
jgi:hypothetical protein